MTAGRPSILVVDDDPYTCEILSHMLEHCGCQVHTTTDVREAMSQLDHTAFAGLLFDLIMPRMSGFELLAYARRTEPNRSTQAVAVTAHSEIAHRAVPSGFARCLAKPVRLEDVRAAFADGQSA